LNSSERPFITTQNNILWAGRVPILVENPAKTLAS
jgi:hypothetical protein